MELLCIDTRMVRRQRGEQTRIKMIRRTRTGRKKSQIAANSLATIPVKNSIGPNPIRSVEKVPLMFDLPLTRENAHYLCSELHGIRTSASAVMF